MKSKKKAKIVGMMWEGIVPPKLGVIRLIIKYGGSRHMIKVGRIVV